MVARAKGRKSREYIVGRRRSVGRGSGLLEAVRKETSKRTKTSGRLGVRTRKGERKKDNEMDGFKYLWELGARESGKSSETFTFTSPRKAVYETRYYTVASIVSADL